MAKSHGKFKWPSFLMGGLFLVISIIIFSYPLKNFYAITWIIGLLSVISGMIEMIFRGKRQQQSGMSRGWSIILGIINIIFGLILMINSAESSVFLIYIFAFWFIISNMVAIFTVTSIERSSKVFHTLSIIMNFVGILFGIVLLFNPLIGAAFISIIIAILFAVFGIFYVLDALSS